MTDQADLKRRSLVKGAISASTLALVASSGLLLPRRLLAHWPSEAFTAQTLEDALLALLGEAEVADDKQIAFKLGAPPSYAVNGASENFLKEISIQIPTLTDFINSQEFNMSIMPTYTTYGEDHGYELPHGNMDFEDTIKVLREIPRKNLEKIVSTAWISMSDYGNENKRRKYLASHLVANELGLAAPAFRSLLRQRSHDRLSEVEQLLSRDRQLIDLHYLHCHYRHELKFREYDDTVDFLRWRSKEFDYEAASQFACIGARKFIKTEKMLAIPEHVQMKLNFYQTDKVRKHVERANEKCQEVCAELNSYFMSSRSRLKQSKKDRLTSDLLPLLLAKGDVGLAVDIKLSMPGHQQSSVARASYSASMSESKRWFKNFKKGLV